MRTGHFSWASGQTEFDALLVDAGRLTGDLRIDPGYFELWVWSDDTACEGGLCACRYEVDREAVIHVDLALP